METIFEAFCRSVTACTSTIWVILTPGLRSSRYISYSDRGDLWPTCFLWNTNNDPLLRWKDPRLRYFGLHTFSSLEGEKWMADRIVTWRRPIKISLYLFLDQNLDTQRLHLQRGRQRGDVHREGLGVCLNILHGRGQLPLQVTKQNINNWLL